MDGADTLGDYQFDSEAHANSVASGFAAHAAELKNNAKVIFQESQYVFWQAQYREAKNMLEAANQINGQVTSVEDMVKKMTAKSFAERMGVDGTPPGPQDFLGQTRAQILQGVKKRARSEPSTDTN